MPGGAYVALTGVRTRMDQLDQIAADLANATTAGYKGERKSTVSAARPDFGAMLDAAVDVTDGPTRIDFSPGTIAATGRDLDAAIDGEGFFVLEGPGGPRYTRNGHFLRAPDGRLSTTSGFAVEGESGEIVIPPDVPITIEPDGTVRAGAANVGKLKVVTFQNNDVLIREGGATFRAPAGITPEDAEEPVIRAGALEGSNVSVIDSMARLVEVSRAYDSLQRGIGVVMNDLDLRAIGELGRK
ncbi:MAG: flagellar hook basal-body protein [Acidobacteriota bacterium]